MSTTETLNKRRPVSFPASFLELKPTTLSRTGGDRHICIDSRGKLYCVDGKLNQTMHELASLDDIQDRVNFAFERFIENPKELTAYVTKYGNESKYAFENAKRINDKIQ